MKIDDLLRESKSLVSLLEDPHPGLSTWHQSVLNVLERIGKGTTAPGSKKYLVIGLYEETDERWAGSFESDDVRPEFITMMALTVAPFNVTVAGIVDTTTGEVVA